MRCGRIGMKSLLLLTLMLPLLSCPVAFCGEGEIKGRVQALQILTFKSPWELTCKVAIKLEGLAADAYRNTILRGKGSVKEFEKVLADVVAKGYKAHPANLIIDGKTWENFTLSDILVNITGLKTKGPVTITILMKLKCKVVNGKFYLFNEGGRLFYYMKGFEYNFLNKTAVLPPSYRVWHTSPTPTLSLLTYTGKTMLEWEVLSPGEHTPIQVCFFNEEKYPEIKKTLRSLEKTLESLQYVRYLGLSNEYRKVVSEFYEVNKTYLSLIHI